MRIENKIVADFYARLFPWIDHTRDVSLCRDDGGSGSNAIADLCFHFMGADEQFRLEFKTLYGNTIGCTAKQFATWRTPTTASPHVWIAIDKGQSFLFWRHDDPAFVTNFLAGKPTSKGRRYFKVVVPTALRRTLPGTFVEILKYAQRARMLR